MKSLRSRLVSLLVSNGATRVTHALAGARRRVLRRPHILHCFLELDDPYSFLLAWHLPALRTSFDVQIEIHLTQALSADYRPSPELLAEYAVLDTERLCSELGVPFLDKGSSPPVEHRRGMLEYLAGRQNDDDSDSEILRALEAYWRGDNVSVARRVKGMSLDGAADDLLAQNSRLLEKLGHFACASVYYEGDWYWGVERLRYLVERLTSVGAMSAERMDPRLVTLQQAVQINLPVAPPTAAKNLPPMEVFFSFRSPYSWVSLQGFIDIANAFGLQLVLRPVLPMVMRGMQVPRNKLIYFMRDAGREARRKSVPYGDFADPLGMGVERCHAVFEYAKQEKREREFSLAACESIWAKGVDVSTDKGLRLVADSAGLFWPDVLEALDDPGWRANEELSRASMTESGCWGVPTVRVGDFATWGQDRDWLLVRHLEERCDTGDGILI
jgi:2-hydroxychromene-2-carboxylate isomerase